MYTEMRCADPLICYTKESGKTIYRNFQYVQKNTLLLQGAKYVLDCGKCVFCRKKRGRDLATRCVLHASLNKENCFLTLTYDEKKKDYHNEYERPDIQKFKKRLRAYVRRRTGKKVELFDVHEYGKNGKKHWHLIAFNYDPDDKTLYTTSKGIPLYTSRALEKLWSHGFVTSGDVSEASALYTAQYMEKDFINDNDSSKKAKSYHRGIGLPYFREHYKQILKLGYIPFGAKKLPISRTFLKEADRHYSYYYDTASFQPKTGCKYPKHRPPLEPNKEIADAYKSYLVTRKEVILDLEEDWHDFLTQNIDSNFAKPDFRQSAENFVHDKLNVVKKEKF